jgi:hypothetical protein
MTQTWLLLLLLLFPRLTVAASVGIAWEFPRNYSPQPERFLITMTSEVGTDQLAAPPSTSAACQGMGDVTQDTYCATLPSCPPDGTYSITVHAAWGEQTSAPTTAVACVFSALMACECLPVEPGPSATPSETPGPAPTTAPLTAAEASAPLPAIPPPGGMAVSLPAMPVIAWPPRPAPA